MIFCQRFWAKWWKNIGEKQIFFDGFIIAEYLNEYVNIRICCCDDKFWVGSAKNIVFPKNCDIL